MENAILLSIKLVAQTDTFSDKKEEQEGAKFKNKDAAMVQIMTECFPKPTSLKDENDLTHILAALIYFKLRKALLTGTTQLETVNRYGVNPKRLSEVLHSKKYLGEKQRKSTGRVDDPVAIEEEEEEERDNTETADEQRGIKCKNTEDDDDDFKHTQEQFSTMLMVKKSHLSKGKATNK